MKKLTLILLFLIFTQTSQAQDEIIIGLLSLELCNCVSDENASSASNIDEFISAIDVCFGNVVQENESVLEQAWTDTTQEFSFEALSNKYTQQLGEELALSCPVFVEKIQMYQQNTTTDSLNTSGSVHEQLFYANKLMEESRCNEAIPVYSEIIRNPSINANLRVTAYNNRGVCRNEIGDYYKAISDLYVALEMNPNYVISYINLGESKTLIGDYNSALADLNYALELNPESKEALSNRGFAYNYLGNYEQAISDFDNALRIDSTYAEAYFGKGNTYLITAENEKALENFKLTEQFSPGYPDLSYYISEAYQGLDMNKEAINSLREDPATKSDYINLNELGLIFYSDEEYDSAAHYYSLSLEIDKSSAQIYLNRAYAYQDNGNHSKAIADFSKVLEMQSNSIEALMLRGNSYTELENFDLALNDYNQAIAFDSTSARVFDNRARLKVKTNDLEGAIDDYTKSIDLYNADPVVFKERGESYLKLEQTEKACSDFNKAKALDSEDVDELIAEHCKE